MRSFYLYKITNLVNGKIYIGISCNPKQRWLAHQSPNSNCTKLKNSIQKHGKDNFKFEVICEGSEGYIKDLEPKAISLYDSIENGYNIFLGGAKEFLIPNTTTRERISLGLKTFYENNVSKNLGRKYDSLSSDVPIYVSGFWFPAVRFANEALGIPKRTLYRRIADGTAGDLIRHEGVKYRSDDKPIFVEGFWFPNTRSAKAALGVAITRLAEGEIGKTHTRFGSPEFKERKSEVMKGKNAGEKNPRYGHRNCPSRSRPVIIQGVFYPSISEAIRQTQYTKSIIEKRIAKGRPGFEYATPKEDK